MFLMLSSLIDSANLFADKAVESIADFNTVLLSANSLSFFPVSSPEDAKSKSFDVKDESTLMESHASETVSYTHLDVYKRQLQPCFPQVT